MPSRTRPMSVPTPDHDPHRRELQHGGAEARRVARLHHRPARRAAGRSRRCRSSSPGPRRTRSRSSRRSGARAAGKRTCRRAAARTRRARPIVHACRSTRHGARLALASVVHDDLSTGVAPFDGRGRAPSLAGAARPVEVAPRPRPPHRAPPRRIAAADEQRIQAARAAAYFSKRERERRHVSPLRNSRTVVPIVMRSPSVEHAFLDGSSFTRVPFVEPRSVSDEPRLVRADLRVPPGGARVGRRRRRTRRAGRSSRSSRPARPDAPPVLAVHEGRRPPAGDRGFELLLALHQRGVAPGSRPSERLVDLERRSRAGPRAPSRARPRSRGRPCQLRDQRVLRLLEPLARRLGRARTTKRFGAQTSLTPTVRPASISLIRRLASSTGCRPERNVLEKRPSTRPPRRRSKSRRFGTGVANGGPSVPPVGRRLSYPRRACA